MVFHSFPAQIIIPHPALLEMQTNDGPITVLRKWKWGYNCPLLGVAEIELIKPLFARNADSGFQVHKPMGCLHQRCHFNLINMHRFC